MKSKRERSISKTLKAILARTTFRAIKEARRENLNDLLALEVMKEEGGMARQILSNRMIWWELSIFEREFEEQLRRTENREQRSIEEHFQELIEVLEQRFPNESRIGTGHVLVWIAEQEESLTQRLLERYRITSKELEEELNRLIRGGEGLRPSPTLPDRRLFAAPSEGESEKRLSLPLPTEKSPSSQKGSFPNGRDLTEEAREGRLDPVIGREKEIERVIQILSRRRKNNPVLVGEAGVGKSAIVEGLALRMAAGEVPPRLRECRIISLDTASLVAGTKFRGEFEERMQQLVERVREAGNVILFIDELHTITGTGSTQGSLDLANLLKPALARGELRLVGATTHDEYRLHIEQDAALERRFSPVKVEPATSEETLAILQRIAPHYEEHHAVRYEVEALQGCVELTDRYLPHRHQPDKAIDLLDEAGALIHAAGKVVVTRRVMEELITRMTGIPSERLRGESKRLLGLREHLSARVIGQEEVIERLSKAMIRSQAGLRDEGRPRAIFLFVGPTGVGKSLLAKELSEWLFGDRRGLIRFDMSEYREPHSLARLIGSPPGYVGYGEGGQLTEAVRRRPYAVLLFDEIEKAHSEVHNALLQLFDEGQLTDGTGRRVDFRQTIVVMTSNAATSELSVRRRVGYTSSTRRHEESRQGEKPLRQTLERHFSPEFLNRIDDLLLFRSLEPREIERIILRELELLNRRAEALGLRIRITRRARLRLAERGYEARYGARALKRTLKEEIEEPLSLLLVEGGVKTGCEVVIASNRSGGVRLEVRSGGCRG